MGDVCANAIATCHIEDVLHMCNLFCGIERGEKGDLFCFIICKMKSGNIEARFLCLTWASTVCPYLLAWILCMKSLRSMQKRTPYLCTCCSFLGRFWDTPTHGPSQQRPLTCQSAIRIFLWKRYSSNICCFLFGMFWIISFLPLFEPWLWLRGWFKGADTTTLTYFLEHRFAKILSDNPGHEHATYIESILACLRASSKIFKILYRASLWLTDGERDAVMDSLRDLLANFKKAAGYSFNVLKLTRFKFQPKYHMLSEVRYELICNRQLGVESLNALAFSCQMDEDFVGRLAQMSRFVSSKAVHRKTVERYKLAVASVWWELTSWQVSYHTIVNVFPYCGCRHHAEGRFTTQLWVRAKNREKRVKGSRM